MNRIALVTADPAVVAGEDVDAPVLIDALRAVDIVTAYVRWDDPAVAWSNFDLVVMRSPWDYPDRAEEFASWLDAVGRQTTVLNPPELIRWNLDKTYLIGLGVSGVDVVPTQVCDAVDSVVDAVHSVAESTFSSATNVVIKPHISAGSRNTGLYRCDDPGAIELATRILEGGKRVLVQEAIDAVQTNGETSLVYFDGRLSHAFTKGPILTLGGGLRGGTYTEEVAAASPSDAQCSVADRALEAIMANDGPMRSNAPVAPPLYARFDLVDGPDRPLLLEAELFEPSYFLPTAPGAETAFVDAIVRRLNRSDPNG